VHSPPLPAWFWAVIAGILAGSLAIGSGIALWHFFNWGQTITQGLQQAAPGLGAMIGSLGTMFSLLPPMLMLMMFTWMLSTFTRLFGE
jgi:hypothetical protein